MGDLNSWTNGWIDWNIVLDMGGRVEVDSKPGEGATFKIYFPVPRSTEAI